ncbi:MAG: hypothetical protein GC154_19160 [bacterium]|nr:hypothetical protein [bacterium]
MAFITTTSNRRTILKQLMFGAAALTLARPAFSQDSTRWAWLSDTHVPQDPTNEYRGFKPYDNIQTVVADILKYKPEGAMISGDLARLEGFPEDYAAFRKHVEAMMDAMPVCMGLGNHDHRANFIAAMKDRIVNEQSVPGKHVVVVDTGPARMIMLDSLMFTNKTPGLLGKAQRTWLEDYLRPSGDKPVILFVHHTLGDGDGELLDSELFLRSVSRIPSVKAVVYGHSHVYRFDTLNGVHLINIPAVGYNFRDQDPVGWIEASVTRHGADLTLHAIAGAKDGDGKTTSLEWRA